MAQLAQPETLNGMDIYMGAGFNVNVGDTVRISLYADSSSQPGTLLSQFDEGIAIVDTDGATANVARVHAAFTTPLAVAGGTTFWIGMAGVPAGGGGDVRIASRLHIADNQMARLNGSTFDTLVSNNDMQFRLHAQAAAVPEPSSIGMLVTVGIGLLDYRRRKRRHAA